MKVIVDTPVWSLALRRRKATLSQIDRRVVDEWSGLVSQFSVTLIGPIRQEVLSGIRDQAAFEKLRETLRAFEDIPLTSGLFEEAARCSNHCRAKGIAGSTIDFLICAASAQTGWAI
jgi:predicted nucleic acid-binding protein